MITDFPEARAQIQKYLNHLIKEGIRQNTPAIDKVTKRILYEGDTIGVVQPDGRHTVETILTMHSEFSITSEEAKHMKPEDFIAKVQTMGSELANQMEASFFNRLNKEVTESGNTVDVRGGFNRDTLLHALNSIHISFVDDKRENPVLPTIMASPGTVQKMIEDENRYTDEETQQFLHQREMILDRKYEEYLEDLKSRKLID